MTPLRTHTRTHQKTNWSKDEPNRMFGVHLNTGWNGTCNFNDRSVLLTYIFFSSSINTFCTESNYTTIPRKLFYLMGSD